MRLRYPCAMSSPASVPRGRFAPTPSGPLHLGSLVTALAGFLDARRAGGRWLLRIDDLDAPRCRPEHVDAILHQLEAHGLEWDESPRRQSAHVDEYEQAFDGLLREGRLYRCRCTRAELAAAAASGTVGEVYPGTCRGRVIDSSLPAAWRLRIPAGPPLVLDDRWQGPLQRDREREVGDFTVRRADGQIGYQLASVIDDRAMRITDAVRGADLVGSSLKQRLLFEAFAAPAPRFAHLPLLTDARGRKLSKQNHAAAIDPQHARDNLQHALRLLGQPPPDAGPVHAQIAEAIDRWDATKVPRTASLPAA